MRLVEGKLSLLKCPSCSEGKSRLTVETGSLHCGGCGMQYPIVDGVPMFAARAFSVPAAMAPGRAARRRWATRLRTVAGSGLWLLYLLWVSARERRGFWGAQGPHALEVERWLPLRYYSSVPYNLYLKAIEVRLFSGLELEGPVLEIGGGGGDTSRLAFAGKRVDVDCEYFVDSIFQFANNGVDIYEVTDLHVGGSVYSLPFVNGAFSTVAMIHVADHLVQMETALRELSRVLRPSGTLAFSTYSKFVFDHLPLFRLLRPFSARLAGAYRRRRCGTWHSWRGAQPYIHRDPELAGGMNLYSISEWAELGARYGLALETARPFTHGSTWSALMDLQRRSHPRFFIEPLQRFVSHMVDKELAERKTLDERDAANLFLVFRRGEDR